jgi:hypothetical protein
MFGEGDGAPRFVVRGLIAAALGLIAACGSDVTPITTCVSAFGLEPDCRFRNPEDLVRVPGTDWLLVSQMADGAMAGSIAAYQPATGRLEELFPTGAFEDERGWGEASCAPPEATAFAPHGMDVGVHPTGRAMLAVVNHGGAETVELLEVAISNQGAALFWRGCVRAPADAFFNDLVVTDDGGFFVTHMMSKRWQWFAQLAGALFGRDTGFVYRWQRDTGFTEVPGTRAPLPNGIAQSTDGRFLYLASMLGDEVRKIDLATGTTVVRRGVDRPDNLSWDDAGRLLIAAHSDSLAELLACGRIDAGACGAAFEIFALDADTLEGFAWLAHRGPPMGGATVAVRLGDSLYLGTFAGDRITRWRIPRP